MLQYNPEKALKIIETLLDKHNLEESEKQHVEYFLLDLKTKYCTGKIDSLNISLRAYMSLKRAKIETIDDFKNFMSFNQQYKVYPKGIGEATMKELLKVYSEISED
jgi:DNA-directed RNA polymerase alpha subunit